MQHAEVGFFEQSRLLKLGPPDARFFIFVRFPDPDGPPQLTSWLTTPCGMLALGVTNARALADIMRCTLPVGGHHGEEACGGDLAAVLRGVVRCMPSPPSIPYLTAHPSLSDGDLRLFDATNGVLAHRGDHQITPADLSAAAASVGGGFRRIDRRRARTMIAQGSILVLYTGPPGRSAGEEPADVHAVLVRERGGGRKKRRSTEGLWVQPLDARHEARALDEVLGDKWTCAYDCPLLDQAFSAHLSRLPPWPMDDPPPETPQEPVQERPQEPPQEQAQVPVRARARAREPPQAQELGARKRRRRTEPDARLALMLVQNFAISHMSYIRSASAFLTHALRPSDCEPMIPVTCVHPDGAPCGHVACLRAAAAPLLEGDGTKLSVISVKDANGERGDIAALLRRYPAVAACRRTTGEPLGTFFVLRPSSTPTMLRCSGWGAQLHLALLTLEVTDVAQRNGRDPVDVMSDALASGLREGFTVVPGAAAPELRGAYLRETCATRLRQEDRIEMMGDRDGGRCSLRDALVAVLRGLLAPGGAARVTDTVWERAT